MNPNNTPPATSADSSVGIKNVVLVHGGFVDGSGWSQVYRGLRKDGYNVDLRSRQRSESEKAGLHCGIRTGQGRIRAVSIANPPPGTPVPPILPPQNGFLFLDRAKFAAAFASDVAPDEAAFMADSQVPWGGVNALAGAVTEPAWRSKRSWYLVTTEDKMIPPPAQRQMAKRAGSTVVETAGSHAIYVSRPQAVIELIEQAAKATG